MEEPKLPKLCPFCKRDGTNITRHHVVPKSRGGKITIPMCRDCHRAAHACFSLKEMEQEFHTPEKLLSRESFRKMVRFISKQDPRRKVAIVRPKDQKHRRRGQ